MVVVVFPQVPQETNGSQTAEVSHRRPSRRSLVVQANERAYYLKGEKYDWVRDPRGFEKLFHKQRSRELRKMIRTIHSITLDAGSGTGLITQHIPGYVVACDLNLWNLKKTKTRIRGDIVQCDLSKLPFRQSFDNVLSSEVLEHISDLPKVLAEIRRVLKPNGRFMGSVPSRSVIWRFRRVLSRTHPHTEPFHNNFSSSELSHWLLTRFSKIKIHSAVFGLSWFFEAQS